MAEEEHLSWIAGDDHGRSDDHPRGHLEAHRVLGDRSFDHDNDTEREDGIHRIDAPIVADEETVKATDDPHILDFRP